MKVIHTDNRAIFPGDRIPERAVYLRSDPGKSRNRRNCRNDYRGAGRAGNEKPGRCFKRSRNRL